MRAGPGLLWLCHVRLDAVLPGLGARHLDLDRADVERPAALQPGLRRVHGGVQGSSHGHQLLRLPSDCCAWLPSWTTQDEVYSECHPRFQYETDPSSGLSLEQIVLPFISLCQGVPVPGGGGGGGHRRHLEVAGGTVTESDSSGGKNLKLLVVTPPMDPESI